MAARTILESTDFAIEVAGANGVQGGFREGMDLDQYLQRGHAEGREDVYFVACTAVLCIYRCCAESCEAGKPSPSYALEKLF